tara:strand:+ start:505 stop:762 length:258 start_codon:yes stop_codon:yes gene_type:complete
MAKEILFLNSAVCKPLPENCPTWVKAKIGINIENLIEEIETLKEAGHIENGWLNLEIKEGKSGKTYCSVNTWKPTAKAKAKAKAT